MKNEKKIRENQIYLLKSLKFKNSNIVTETDEMMMDTTCLWKHLFIWSLHVIINFGESSPTYYFLNRVCCKFLFFRMIIFFLGEVLASSKYWRPNWKSHWWYTRSNNFFECECKLDLRRRVQIHMISPMTLWNLESKVQIFRPDIFWNVKNQDMM